MTPKARRFIFPLTWINFSVLLFVLIQATGNPAWDMRALLRSCFYPLVFANLVGIPASVVLPFLLERFARYKPPSILWLMVACLLFTAIGSLGAEALFLAVGVVKAQYFWQYYFNTMRVAMFVAPLVCLAAFFYTSLRNRAREAEERLREKEIAEERSRKLAAEARLSSLESHIHPHFLFNTLNSITSLIAVNPARAEQLVGRLSALLRSSLDTAKQILIPLEQELEMVKCYVEIEQARYGDKLRGRLEVPADLLNAKVPPLSIQSLVENAVKHGITPQRSGGEYLVSASAKDGNLRIEVSDTGPGFDLAAIQAGHGLDNLVGRLDALFGQNAHLKVFRQNERCVVEMILPLL